MSRYLSRRLESLREYVPGEQPQDKTYIKLNTNESPYPPSPAVFARLNDAETAALKLYPDPDGAALRGRLASLYGVAAENVLLSNGSDEALSFAFMAFCDAERGAAFPDISYGFYKVFAQLYGIPYRQIPLRADFTVDTAAYPHTMGMIVLANPNAPTGIALPLSAIETLVRENPDSVVLIDEAYVDFGGESAVPLTKKYSNLLVVQTFSKSRSMAGARLGYAIGDASLIADLNRVRCSVNPYNVNRLTLAAGEAALDSQPYYDENCRRIIETREKTAAALAQLGFTMTDSRANFLFAETKRMDGASLYRRLKERGILVRHFDAERIGNHLRITVGSPEEMQALTDTLGEILCERTEDTP